MKKNNGWIVVIAAIVLSFLPCLAGLLLWNKLPEKLPIHYSAENVADGFAGKLFGVLFLPLFCVALCLLFTLLLKRFMRDNIKLFTSVMLLPPLLSIGLQSMLLCNALGTEVSATAVSLVIVGIVCIPLGNYMPTVRPNGLVGARYPWIMDDPDAWEKTQRLTGKLLIIWGAAMFFSGLFNIGGESGMIAVMLVGPLILLVVTGVYSYAKAQE